MKKDFLIIDIDKNLEVFSENSAINMAIDEMLFQKIQNSSNSKMFLRFYDWKTEYLSFGYTQRINNKPELLNKFFNEKQQLVRRPTGGGFVHHGNDLCITLIANLKDFSDLENLEKSYQLTHFLFLEGIKKFLNIFFENNFNNNLNLFSLENKSVKSSFCFEKPVLSDIMLSGKKIVGSAQRRIFYKDNFYLIQQTSLNFENLFEFKDMKIKNFDLKDLSKIISIEFEKKFNVNFESYNYSSKDLEISKNLFENKYKLDIWNKKI